MRVNSFTLFGDRGVWAAAVAVNLRQHVTMYPGWTFWLHTDRELDDAHYCPVIRKLAEAGLLRLTIVPATGELHRQRWLGIMQLWRLLPLWEHTDYVFCRDLDSIMTPRQLQCVRSFIASGKAAHGIQDNPMHTLALMGGMCGFQTGHFHRELGSNAAIHDQATLIKAMKYSKEEWNIKGSDQDLLTDVVQPYIAKSLLLVHKLEGPNRRAHLKHVTNADINDIPAEVRNRGDDFTNYIGAAGCTATMKQMVDFYNEHGNRAACAEITAVERACGWEPPHDA